MQLTLTMDDGEVRLAICSYMEHVLGPGWTVDGAELQRKKGGDFVAAVEVTKDEAFKEQHLRPVNEAARKAVEKEGV
jgi:hypothetical protein